MDGAPACPFVAFGDDRDGRSTSPDHRHRCFAESPPAPRALAHQEAYCLSSAFPVCPTFQDWARREAAHARGGGDEAETAPTAVPTSAPAPAPDLVPQTDPPAQMIGEPPVRRNPPRDWAAPPPWAGGAVRSISGGCGERRGGRQRVPDRTIGRGPGAGWKCRGPFGRGLAPFLRGGRAPGLVRVGRRRCLRRSGWRPGRSRPAPIPRRTPGAGQCGSLPAADPYRPSAAGQLDAVSGGRPRSLVGAAASPGSLSVDPDASRPAGIASRRRPGRRPGDRGACPVHVAVASRVRWRRGWGESDARRFTGIREPDGCGDVRALGVATDLHDQEQGQPAQGRQDVRHHARAAARREPPDHEPERDRARPGDRDPVQVGEQLGRALGVGGAVATGGRPYALTLGCPRVSAGRC